MGSGWSAEEDGQALQERPASASAATGSDGHDRGKAVSGSLGAEVKLEHGLEAILKDADLALDRSSLDKLRAQLHAGILLNEGTKKYWLDKESNGNCFMLFPRALSITWVHQSKYWRWKSLEELSNTIEIVELINVCWLEINGKIKTCELSPGVLYEAFFMVMITDPSYGWDVPVNIRLKKPDGSKKERLEALEKRPRGQWFEIPIGDFVVDHKNGGEIEFDMYEYEGGMWKKGMLLKGVVIRTKPMV
ncbi:lectin-like [Cucurbita moschata]|uniref:Lectin-like n=1 Tax=Cucurbita moschata TaxID=3662 RepID=A0A6J1EK84_CUCMO|nr:lectin-like [Cucurbita moschata]